MNSTNNPLLLQTGRLPVTAAVLRDDILSGGCELAGTEPAQPIRHIVVSNLDSIQRKCMFVPHKENDDQCREMVRKGAACVLTDHAIPGIPCLVVKDVTQALYCICKWMAEAISLPSVVVAGCEGKTTTKRMIKSVLETERSASCQTENYNTLQSLCCCLQYVEASADLLVQEVDEKRTNNTVYCSTILKPQIAVITNIAEAHISSYGSKEALIGSFEGITAGMPDDGVVILNGDDKDSLRANFGKRVIKVGVQNEDCDYLAKNIVVSSSGTRYDLYNHGQCLAQIKLRVHGIHNIYNSMMAFVTGSLMGVSEANICKGLLAYKNSGIRQNICRIGRTMIYADCYNASATSVRFAVKCFDELTPGKKTVLVLGDIAEIEGHEEENYRQIAECVNESHADVVCAYGRESGRIFEYVTRPVERMKTSDLNELAAYLKELKRKGYTGFLFKASRVMKLEQAIKAAFPMHYKMIQLEERFSG